MMNIMHKLFQFLAEGEIASYSIRYLCHERYFPPQKVQVLVKAVGPALGDPLPGPYVVRVTR